MRFSFFVQLLNGYLFFNYELEVLGQWIQVHVIIFLCAVFAVVMNNYLSSFFSHFSFDSQKFTQDNGNEREIRISSNCAICIFHMNLVLGYSLNLMEYCRIHLKFRKLNWIQQTFFKWSTIVFMLISSFRHFIPTIVRMFVIGIATNVLWNGYFVDLNISLIFSAPLNSCMVAFPSV